MKDRKKLMIIMSVILAVLIIIGIIIGVTKEKKAAEMEEEGIIYQDGSEAVEIWDDDEFVDDDEVMSADAEVEDAGGTEGVVLTEEDRKNAGTKNNSDRSNATDKGTTNKGTTNKDNAGSGNSSTGNEGNSSNGNSGNSGSNSSDEKPSKVPEAGRCTYEQYMAMTPEQQQKYFESFDSEYDFFDWYRKAKAEYDKNKDSIEIEGGDLDIGDYMD